MTATDIIAILALVVAAGSFALEVRRWFEGGAKLTLSLMADAVEIPDTDGGRRKLILTVTNRGDVPTTITHMIVFAQRPWWRLQKRHLMSGVVNSTIQPIPFELGVNKRWMGRLAYDEKLLNWRAKKQLYVGVIAAHSNKNFLVRVPLEKKDVPKAVVA